MRILFLSPWFPYPPDNGSKIRIYYLLRALAERHEITLLSFVRNGEHVEPNGLEGICRAVYTAPWREFVPRRLKALLGFLAPTPRSAIDTYSPEMARLVTGKVQQESPGIIVASQSSTARYAYGIRNLPRIFDEVELSVIQGASANAPSLLHRWRYRLTWTKLRRYTTMLLSDFDACTVVSEPELAILRQAMPNYERVHIIPNGVDLETHRLGLAQPQPNTLIYTGALTYSANYDAASYFLSEIWPRIRGVVSEAQFSITGSTIGVPIDKLSLTDGVTLTGYVDDIRPLVAGAWACVIPLRVGGGTRLKILEAMALGTPVISTLKGAEGLDVTPDQDILIADTPADFATETTRLLRDPGLRDYLARNARQLVERKYDWREIGQRFTSLVEDIAGTGGKAC